MSKKTIGECRSGKDLLCYSEKHGATIRHGHSGHQFVCTEKGKVPIPVHGNGDLGTGIRHKIIRELATIGITCLLVACILLAIIH